MAQLIRLLKLHRQRCVLLEAQSAEWMEEREQFRLLQARHKELENVQQRTHQIAGEPEERCMEEEEMDDLIKELTVTREQLQQAGEELRPPADIPSAETREALLCLLDCRQVEISCLMLEWKGLADRLETMSSAKQEIQVCLDKLVAWGALLQHTTLQQSWLHRKSL